MISTSQTCSRTAGRCRNPAGVCHNRDIPSVGGEPRLRIRRWESAYVRTCRDRAGRRVCVWIWALVAVLVSRADVPTKEASTNSSMSCSAEIPVRQPVLKLSIPSQQSLDQHTNRWRHFVQQFCGYVRHPCHHTGVANYPVSEKTNLRAVNAYNRFRRAVQRIAPIAANDRLSPATRNRAVRFG